MMFVSPCQAEFTAGGGHRDSKRKSVQAEVSESLSSLQIECPPDVLQELYGTGCSVVDLLDKVLTMYDHGRSVPNEGAGGGRVNGETHNDSS